MRRVYLVFRTMSGVAKESPLLKPRPEILGMRVSLTSTIVVTGEKEK